MGRPSTFTQQIADTICERLAKGEPLAQICRDDAMPGYSTVKQWEANNPTFAAISARARVDGTHYIADDCIRISDDPTIDPQNKRIMVDTRLRLIGKWNTKAYGEKLGIDHSGEIVTLTPEQRQARIAELVAKHGADGS